MFSYILLNVIYLNFIYFLSTHDKIHSLVISMCVFENYYVQNWKISKYFIILAPLICEIK